MVTEFQSPNLLSGSYELQIHDTDSEELQVDIDGDAEEIYEAFLERGWGDGLPFIPPTEKRVARMLEFTDREADEVLGLLPPTMGIGTVEKLAINAVMAGCRPEYFPVVLTAVEAALSEEANLRAGLSTAFTSWPVFVINGPIRDELEINCSWGVLSNWGRANATIGRALTLIFTNIGGAVPGITEKKIHGVPTRFTPVIGEFEEESPWEPLHVERGFPLETSTVTVFADQCMPIFIYTHVYGHPTYELYRWAQGMACVTHVHPSFGGHGCDPLLMVNPASAKEFAAEGWRKKDVKKYLYENARNHREALITSPHNALVPRDVQENIRSNQIEEGAKWCQEINDSPYVVNPYVPIVQDAEDFQIVVAGAEAALGGKLIFFPGHAHREKSVTKAITRSDGTPLESVFDFKNR